MMGWHSRGAVVRAALISMIYLSAAGYAAGQNEIKEGSSMAMQVASPAFDHQTSIPIKYTCRGRDVSPPLEWSDVPAGVKSYALIVDDPDAPMGTWVHWVVFNIPASTRSLSENVPPGPRLEDGSIQGVGSAGRNGYQGPCPPSGRHRYYFKIYALDTALDLPQSANKNAVVAAMQGHVLAQGQLMGYFSK